MKTLNVTWDGIQDPTGYLFSFAKSLSCAVKHSPWPEYAEDIVATSGFAFRMWVTPDLCPSATSIWEFRMQKSWVENGGFTAEYVERLWGVEAEQEEARRREAVETVKRSIDRGIPAVSWDIGVPEWGLITSYDDAAATFATLSITGEGDMPYTLLGKRELPILSVLTLCGRTGKPEEAVLRDTMHLAVSHLGGEEWCENAKGLDAYPALIRQFETDFRPDLSWNQEYFLGTYGALKYYAWRYFDKMGQAALAAGYKRIYEAWLEAFQTKTGQDCTREEVRERIAALLKSAEREERLAYERMLEQTAQAL